MIIEATTASFIGGAVFGAALAIGTLVLLLRVFFGPGGRNEE